MKTLYKTGMLVGTLLMPIASFAGDYINSAYNGTFTDSQNQVSIKLDAGGLFSSEKVTLSTRDGKSRQQKVKELTDMPSITAALVGQVDPKHKDKPAIPPAGAYSIRNKKENTSDIYLVTPTGAPQQSDQGIVWYEADIAILPLAIRPSDKVQQFEATRCEHGSVMIDTLATDPSAALEIACSEDEVNLLMKRVK